MPVANTLAAGGRGEKLAPVSCCSRADAADMVDMLVAVEQDPDVAELEAELPDVVGDQVRAGLRAGVDQDMPFAAGDQDAAMPQVPTR